jgi:hypothetical protein
MARSSFTCAAWRQFADLVEEQRAAGGFDELAGVLFGRAGERAFLVPEQRGLHQIFGIAPQFTATNGLARRSPEPWMARAISSLPTPDSPSISTGMSEPVVFSAVRSTCCMRALRVTMSLKLSVPVRLRFNRWNSVSSALTDSALRSETCSRSAPTGFNHEIGRAGAHRRHHGVDAAMRGLHDHRIGQAGIAHAREHAVAVEVGHHQVEDDAIDARAVRAGQCRDGRVAAVGGHHLVAETPRHGFEQAALHGIVVDDQDQFGHRHSGCTDLGRTMAQPA